MAGLSKSRLLAHRQCPKRLWLQIHQPELLPATDIATQARFNTGNQVGEIARSLYPDGVLIDTDNLQQALRDTAEVLATSPTLPIFEATFDYDGVLVRADLLLPEIGGYRLVEVKSSASVKDYHLIDAAVQSWVVQQSGLTVTGTAIAHIDTGFVYLGNGDYRELLKEIPIDGQLTEILPQVPYWVTSAKATLSDDEPVITPGEQCEAPFVCPFYEHCNPASADSEVTYPPEDLPRHNGLAAQLRQEGYDDLRQVPAERLSKPLHQRVHDCAQNGLVYLDPQARRILEDLPYPRFYIDFETYAPAVPIWSGTRPYTTQVPFQWSCHAEDKAGHFQHHAFLAQNADDPRRNFIDSLLAVLGTSGAILVYNAAFECSRLRELAVLFPDLAVAIQQVIARIVDLLPIARAHYYHPNQHGSWSIKSVLPTIAPELAYDNLTVANGGMAQTAFQEMIDTNTTEERRQSLRQALLVYCERDTLAMVRIAQHFQLETGDNVSTVAIVMD